jgi:hypothetical protein
MYRRERTPVVSKDLPNTLLITTLSLLPITFKPTLSQFEKLNVSLKGTSVV